MKRVAVIILNWNCVDDSIRCIKSLKPQLTKNDKIIVIDNASSDNSVTILKKTYKNKPYITLIHNLVNKGYAGGINTGITWAIENNYRYVAILNPDAIACENWIKYLIGGLSDNTDITTGLLLNKTGDLIDSAGDFYTAWGIPGPRGRGRLSNTAPKKEEYIFGATGGAVMYKINVFKKIGLLDEKFFMYYEDIDLCFRAQLSGFKTKYIPNAIAYHDQGKSAKKVPGLAIYHTFKNLPMLFTKNVPFSLFFHIYPRFCLAYFLILGNAIKNGNGIPALKGFMMSWLLLVHMFKERLKIQSSRKVTDLYIKSIILHDIPHEQTGMRAFRKFFIGK